MADIIPFYNGRAKPGFVDTKSAASVFGALDYCRDSLGMVTIVGAPGVGKTTAIREYMQRTEYVDDTFYACMSPAIARTMTKVLEALCEAVGRPTNYGRPGGLHMILRDRFADFHRTCGSLLIVDEAQYLSKDTLEEIRCFHDATRVAVAFCGNPAFLSSLRQHHYAAFAQFTTRIGMRLTLDELDEADVGAFCAAVGIEGAEKVRCVQTFAKRDGGGYRSVDKLIALAERYGGGKGVTLEHLRHAARVLGDAS